MKPGQMIKTFTSAKGTVVTFRYIKRDDLDGALQYINTLIAEDTFIGLYGKPLTRSEEKKFLEESLKDLKTGEKSHIIVEVNGHIVGEAELRRQRLPRNKHVGSVAISLLSPYRQEGIGTELMKTLVKEAKRLGMRLIELTCFENNPRALHVYEKIGFRSIGVIPGAIIYKGKYVGEVVLYLSLANDAAIG